MQNDNTKNTQELARHVQSICKRHKIEKNT